MNRILFAHNCSKFKRLLQYEGLVISVSADEIEIITWTRNPLAEEHRLVDTVLKPICHSTFVSIFLLGCIAISSPADRFAL